MAKTTIHSDYIPDNAITSTKIAENSIGAREIATNAITTLYVADGSVTTVKIADDAITSAKLDTNIDIAGTFDVTGTTTLDSGLTVDTTTLVVDASNNRVGVGTASPSGTLDVQAANAGSGIRLTATTGTNGAQYKATTGAGNLYMGIDTSVGGSFGKANSAVFWYDAAQPVVFATNNAEKMRIDSSGNLLVGKTSSAFGTAGVEASASNGLWSTRSGLPPLALNRLSSNGNIADFYKDSTQVGSIGVVSDDRMYFSTADGLGLQFDKDNNRIIPCDAAGAYNNNVELGDTSLEFTNLWLSSATRVGSTATEYAEGHIRFKYNGGSYIDQNTVGQSLNFRVSNASSLDTTAMAIDSSGLVRIGASGGTGQRLSINGFTQSNTMSEANAWLVAEANGGDGIAIGTRATSPYATWIQSGYLNTLGTSNHYALALNPHGGNVGIGETSPDRTLHIVGPDGSTNLVEGNSRTALFLDNAGATYINLASSNTANAGIFFSDSDANNRGGIIYEHANDALTFDTAATEAMRILSTGQIVTGGLTSTTSALHLYSNNSWSGILTLQSQAAANATAQITFMSRDSSNVNDDAYIKYNNSGGAETNQLDFLPSNNRTFSVSNHGSTHYGDESTNNGIGKFIGSVAPHSSGNRYVHVQLSTTYNEMAHIFIHGYSYSSALIEGACAFYFYNNANQTTLYDFRSSGSIVAGHCNSSNNYAEIVIDTVTTAQTNRWGSISIYGGQDRINSYHHTEIVQVAWNNSTARQFT